MFPFSGHSKAVMSCMKNVTHTKTERICEKRKIERDREREREREGWKMSNIRDFLKI